MTPFLRLAIRLSGSLGLTLIIALSAQAVNFGFANAEKGREILLGDEAFYEHLSPAEIAIRLGSSTADKSVDDLKAVYGAAVQEWSVPEIVRMSQLIAANRQIINQYAALLPDVVYFVKVSDVVEGGLPHTRGNGIFLSQSSGRLTQTLFFHELFHVLTRGQAEERDSLYGLIGFSPCTLEETTAMKGLRLTNSDVPLGGYYLPSSPDGKKGVIPHLYTSRPAFDSKIKGGFSGHFGFGLLGITVDGGVCTPNLDEKGDLVLKSPSDLPFFFDAIGRNTGYIIHAEEVLADNFTYLVLGKQDLPNPEIPQKLADWLKAHSE